MVFNSLWVLPPHFSKEIYFRNSYLCNEINWFRKSLHNSNQYEPLSLHPLLNLPVEAHFETRE